MNEPVVAPEAPPGQAGMRVFIDPESGTIGVPPVLPAPDVVVAPSPNEQPVQVVMPDGSVMVDLKETCQEYVLMQLDANGHMSMRCVWDPKVASPAPAPQPQDR